MRAVGERRSVKLALPWEGSSFNSSAVRPSGPATFEFIVGFVVTANSSFMDSIPRALATGGCGSRFRVSGKSMLDFAFSSERKNLVNMLYVPQPSPFLVKDVIIRRFNLPSFLQLNRTHTLKGFPLVSDVQLRFQPNDLAFDEKK